MEPSGRAPLRASFTNSNGGPINPFSGKPVQSAPGLSSAQRLADPSAEARLRDLVGASIIDVVAESSGEGSRDPVFVFADGARLEIFADTDLDPWVIRPPDKTFVGSASGPTAGDTGV